MAAPRPSFPDDAIQALVGQWWIEDGVKPQLCRGRLIQAYVPHLEWEPRTLAPKQRGSSTDHNTAVFEAKPLRIGDRRTQPQLPIAGLTLNPGEVYLVQRAKRRPAVILGGHDTPEVEPSLTRGMPNWQTAQTVVVAPYYGATKTGTRAGFNAEFLDRVRKAEYPEYVWDSLPLPGETTESILMLNRLQHLGRHYNTYELTSYRLSDVAVGLLDDWVEWLLTGTLAEHGVLKLFRDEIGAI